MDLKLLAWGRRRKPVPLPRLWLFTDEGRLGDPRAAVARLPRGRAGVVLRHDRDPARAALARDLSRICRQRRLILVIAGDARLAAAVRAGVHLRGGFRCGNFRCGGFWRGGLRRGPLRPQDVVTSSAHSVRDLRRARKSGAMLAFLSPVFATASHAGAPGLGSARWAAMVRRAGHDTAGRAMVPGQHHMQHRMMIAALGGVDGRSVRRLPPSLCYAAGAIGALA